MRVTVTISIGRNIDGRPMTDDRWESFRDAVSEALAWEVATTYVDGALSTGSWQGAPETSATWVASLSESQLPTLRIRLRILARRFHQDAIALTVGATELLGDDHHA